MSTPVLTRLGVEKSKIQTRSVVRQQQQKKTRQPNATLQEAKRKAKEKLASQKIINDTIVCKDIFQSAMDSVKNVRGHTGIVYDNRMAEHRCLWDPNYPECPERFTRVLERCQALKLIERCKPISSRSATIDEVLIKHTKEHYDVLKATSDSTDNEQLEDLSSRYDAVYIHPSTFELSLLAVGSTIELVDSILLKGCQNGMAIIRPPGHHAMKAEFNGYCFFNNVAIAAQRALDELGAQRILIVDWDIHHGQASQRMFYDDPRILYFSIHRYEHGLFWPNLRESDYDYIGNGTGKGFNFNLPLNQTGMTNADYLAIWQQVLLPVAMEFCPDLVIVSAGFDSALGDEKGVMEITPAFYSHLLSPLMAFAEGKVAVVLEGGYCLQSLSEGAALTLRTLLGDPCPLLVEPLQPPTKSVQETILNCIHAHRPYWNSLQTNATYGLEELNNVNPQPNLHKVMQAYKWTEPTPERFPTRDFHPVQSMDLKVAIAERLTKLSLTTNLTVAPVRVSYVYDDLMLQHKNIYEDHPERPERIQEINERFREFGLLDRVTKLDTRVANTDELCLAHTAQHVDFIRQSVRGTELREIGEEYNSVYFHQKTFESATVAAGSVLQVVDDVLNGNSRSGVCVVRPPGHHAEHDIPHGFCIFNNVAVAANYAIRDHGLKRVLIVDWDVHHGNGTQHIFESNPNVLYISIHRYDYGNFFPKKPDADYTVVGENEGEGFNVNIPWNKKGMGDMEYALAFQRIIMPIAYEFDPELVLVSAGFDAAIGDPLGGCKVTPEAYGVFTHWLSSLAAGRLILCLEGGYNVNSVAYAMTMCTKALLGDPIPKLQNTQKVNASSVETIQNVLSVQKKYWKSLQFNQKLPNFDISDSLQMNELSKCLEAVDMTSKCQDAADNASPSDGKDNRQIQDDQPGPSGLGKTDGAAGGFKTLSEYLAEQELENKEMFAIYPKTDCPHLVELPSAEQQLQRIDTKQLCSICSTNRENWWCLHCNEICCGRYVNEHMMFHHLSSDHPLALSFADLSVWCYKCQSYIDNPHLFKFKNLAHADKFGEEMLWTYGSDTLTLLK